MMELFEDMAWIDVIYDMSPSTRKYNMIAIQGEYGWTWTCEAKWWKCPERVRM